MDWSKACPETARVEKWQGGPVNQQRQHTPSADDVSEEADLELAREDMRINGVPPTPSRWQRKFGWGYRKTDRIMRLLGCR
jgi:hypothetical protein